MGNLVLLYGTKVTFLGVTVKAIVGLVGAMPPSVPGKCILIHARARAEI
jgi:hypothetical protein